MAFLVDLSVGTFTHFPLARTRSHGLILISREARNDSFSMYHGRRYYSHKRLVSLYHNMASRLSEGFFFFYIYLNFMVNLIINPNG